MGGDLRGMHVITIRLGTTGQHDRVIGPFKTGVEAHEWAAEHLDDKYEWFVTPLEEPDAALSSGL